MTEYRSNPERLLKLAQEEELNKLRGKLKIYLGAAPGVGKTYTMLQDALSKRIQGLDVIIGVIETHGRKEVENLAKDFETLSLQTVRYRGKEVLEFDLDGAIKRNPALILIDEMAHTNIPGLRHIKRWHDIKELLDRGIDVYTTLNVQHIESLNDIVAQIISVHIKETVPDYLLELADTIELVDLPPEDLLKRLQEGKIYFPEHIGLACENFFQKGNLIALRELALRITAERVNTQVLYYRYGQGIERIWPTKEKILVCVGTDAGSAKVVRAARRMVAGLQAEWIAIHVETPKIQLSKEQRDNAIQNLRLAEQLGAETRILNGVSVVKEIISFARERNINKIVMGKKNCSRWKDIFSRSLVNELIRSSGEIDIYIIRGDITGPKAIAASSLQYKEPPLIYGLVIGFIAIATLVALLLNSYLSADNVVMVYLLIVTVVALFGKIGPSILASVLSVLAYYFFFIPPQLSFVKTNMQYFLTLGTMLFVMQLISHLTVLARSQVKTASFAEQRIAALHALSRKLASTRGIYKLLKIAIHYIAELFDSEVQALLPEGNNLVVRASFKGGQVLSDKEKSIVKWVYDMGQIAGLGTDTLPFSEAVYIPMLASKGVIGVLQVRPRKAGNLFTPERIHLLESCANQAALAMEVDRLQEQAKKMELQHEVDRIRSIFYNLFHKIFVNRLLLLWKRQIL